MLTEDQTETNAMARTRPEGYHSITPYITVHDAKAAIEFYKQVFDAETVTLMEDGNGKIIHGEIKICDSHLMLADEFEEWGNKSPRTLGDSPSSLMLYVDDVDAVFARAIEAGATERMPVSDQFYGDRSGQVEDPFGHRWSLSTMVEELSPEQVEQRFADWQNKA